MSAQNRPEPPPTDLWNEEGSWVWIRYDLCENAGKARYKAFTGEGLPIGFRDEGWCDLIDLRVRVVWAREMPDSEWDEWPWKPCGPDEPGAVKFWQVDSDPAPLAAASSGDTETAA